jgi:hypothetical protein
MKSQNLTLKLVYQDSAHNTVPKLSYASYKYAWWLSSSPLLCWICVNLMNCNLQRLTILCIQTVISPSNGMSRDGPGMDTWYVDHDKILWKLCWISLTFHEHSSIKVIDCIERVRLLWILGPESTSEVFFPGNCYNVQLAAISARLTAWLEPRLELGKERDYMDHAWRGDSTPGRLRSVPYRSVTSLLCTNACCGRPATRRRGQFAGRELL